MRRKGKCIDCRHCKKEALLCIMTSEDCIGACPLTVNDLYNENYCDYFEKIEEKKKMFISRKESNKDFRHCSRYDIEAELDKLITEEIDEIYITHVVSMDFLEMFDLEASDTFEDFNGWQCDWWGSMEYKGVKVKIAGGAIYGTISLYLDEEENDDED